MAGLPLILASGPRIRERYRSETEYHSHHLAGIGRFPQALKELGNTGMAGARLASLFFC
jgi:hypothetical protein